MSDFNMSQFKQRMLKYYEKLEAYGFGSEAIEQLKVKEIAVIDFATLNEIWEGSILPVVPNTDMLSQYIRAIESIFPEFTKQRDLFCKRPHQDCPYLKDFPRFVDHEKNYLKFFNDIPDTPKEPYFIIMSSGPLYAPANAAYLRQMIGKSKEEQDKFLTMFETFSLFLFDDLKYQFEQNDNFDGLFVLNSYLSENRDDRIILTILKDKYRLPVISHYQERRTLASHSGYAHDGGGSSNFAYRLIARI